jgi:hypothetical protein
MKNCKLSPAPIAKILKEFEESKPSEENFNVGFAIGISNNNA